MNIDLRLFRTEKRVRKCRFNVVIFKGVARFAWISNAYHTRLASAEITQNCDSTQNCGKCSNGLTFKLRDFVVQLITKFLFPLRQKLKMYYISVRWKCLPFHKEQKFSDGQFMRIGEREDSLAVRKQSSPLKTTKSHSRKVSSVM